MIEFRVEGRPAPKGSRMQGYTKSGKGYTYPASKHEKPWVDAVKNATQVAMRHHPPVPPPYAVDLEILIATVRRPRYTYPVVPDIDKVARATIDGMVNGGALCDDSHVTALTVTKRYVRPDEAPGAYARFWSLAASEQILI
jgi:Holliday junction resolvase RusA-like endonuclease